MAVKKKVKKVKLAARKPAPKPQPLKQTAAILKNGGKPKKAPEVKEPVIRLFRDFTSHYYLRLRRGTKYDYFLTMFTGAVTILKLTEDKYSALHPAPVADTPQRMVEVCAGTHLSKSVAAQRAIDTLQAGGDLDKIDLDVVEEAVAAVTGKKGNRKERTPKAPGIPGGVALKTICAKCGVDPRIARRVLRAKKVERTGRWEFAPERVAEIEALLKAAPK